MICPKCNKDLIHSINYKKGFFNHFKVYNIFCLNCDYEFIKNIEISKEDFNNSLNCRIAKTQNTKKLNTNKTYNQNINNIK